MIANWHSKDQWNFLALWSPFIYVSDQIANICWIIEKPREFQKNIYFCFIDYAKAFDFVDHKKQWEILKRWEYQTT